MGWRLACGDWLVQAHPLTGDEEQEYNTSESSDGSSRFHVADECDPTGSKGVDRSQAFGMTNTLSHHEELSTWWPGGEV